MKHSANILKSIVEPLADMLSEQNLPVHFKGREAQTLFDTKTGKPKEIILPMISGDAEAPVVDAFHGYLDHEVGHVLFTEFTPDITKLIRRKEPYKTMFNIVEDTRIEKLMCKRFRGTRHNLNKLYAFTFGEDDLKEIDSLDVASPEAIISYVLYAVRALAEQEHFVNLLGKSEMLKKMADRLREPFGARIASVGSSLEAAELGAEIADFLRLKAPKQKSDDSSSEGSEGKPGKGGRRKRRVTIGNDYFEQKTASKLSKAAEELGENSRYSVYTTDDDVIKPAKIKTVGSPILASGIEEKTTQMTGVLQKRLERIMAARSLAVWTGGFRTGKLHSAALNRLFTGDERIFRRKQEARSKDVAVSMLIDCSGSMTIGQRLMMACCSAYAMATALNRIGIACEILGFTTVDVKPQNLDYSRVAGLYIPIFKSFHEPWNAQTKNRLASCALGDSEYYFMNNVDGESVQIAAERLLMRREKRKILFVLSDGLPASDGNNNDLRWHLNRVVEDFSRDIEIVGIGIKREPEEMKRYYPNFATLSKLEDLPGCVMNKIESCLLER